MSFTRGDIHYVDAIPVAGHEMLAGRPAVIVSNNKCNERSPVLEVVYLTTADKPNLPTHVTIRSAPRVSTVLCEQVHSVDASRIGNFCGRCTEQELQAIDAALLISLGLSMGGGSSEPRPVEPSDTAAELIAVRAQLDLMRQMYDDLLRHKV